MRIERLLGTDHLAYREVVGTSVPDVVGIALTAGWGPSSVKKLDGNEDAVGFSVDGQRVRVAVADGHSGFSAARAAIGVSLDDPAAPHVVMGAADEAAIAASRAAGQPLSATTLVIAEVDGATLTWASVGDSALYLVRDAAVARLDRPSSMRFVGYDGPDRVLAVECMSYGVERVIPGDVVIAASDGFTDVVRGPDGDRIIADVIGSADGDVAQAAVELVRRAEHRSVLDNIAVAVTRVSASRSAPTRVA